MTTMITTIAGIHGTRLRVESVATPAVAMYVRAWKQRPAVITLGGFSTDNSTGVSEVEYRHT
jgi:hypothetical protein